MLSGIFFKAHGSWLQECGSLTIYVSISVWILTVRSYFRDTIPGMERLQQLCSAGGVRFGFANATYRWVWPFTFATSFLSVTFMATELFIRTQHQWFRLVSDAFAIPCVVGFATIMTRTRNLESILRKLESITHPGKLASSPPKAAKFVLLLVPRRYREHLVGDLEEEYTTIVLPEYGAKSARLWYWWQVITSIAPLLWQQAKEVAGLVFVWKSVR